MPVKTVSDMLLVIDALRATDQYIKDIYLNGGCFRFYLFLKKIAPSCEPMINKQKDHIVTLFQGVFFDIRGIVDGFYEPMTQQDIIMASKWSFSEHMALKIQDCPWCDEPIVC